MFRKKTAVQIGEREYRYQLGLGKSWFPFSHLEVVVAIAAAAIILTIMWPWFTETMERMMDQGVVPPNIQGK